MRETKVNLKHLLEDIRDSYLISLEEIILAELAANALDCGASQISFFVEPNLKTITCLDNGQGMKRNVLAQYHNIASTTKQRGRGIGFAGIGAKLSLLTAEKVITETKGGYGSHCSTEWQLKSDISAPWKFKPSLGKVKTTRGTAVSIILQNPNSSLLRADFIKKTITDLFLPLLLPEFFSGILKTIYKKGVEFYLDNEKIVFDKALFSQEFYSFQIRKAGSRALAGAGFLTKSQNNQSGLAVSTFGKVIKFGWEWVGITPKVGTNVWGLVEVPGLSAILTTNKMDFLKDTSNLKKYYQFRKEIQIAIVPILNQMNVLEHSVLEQRNFRKLKGELETTLRGVIGQFPELGPLFGVKKTKKAVKGFLEQKQNQVIDIERVQKSNQGVQDEPNPIDDKIKNTEKRKKQTKGPTLAVALEELTEQDPLARMQESKILINTKHPAFSKALFNKQEENIIIFAVALTLSRFLESAHLPQDFIDNFLAVWGKGEQKTQLSLT